MMAARFLAAALGPRFVRPVPAVVAMLSASATRSAERLGREWRHVRTIRMFLVIPARGAEIEFGWTTIAGLDPVALQAHGLLRRDVTISRAEG